MHGSARTTAAQFPCTLCYCAGVYIPMQQSWKQLAADMEQQQQALQQPQPPDSTAQHTAVQAAQQLAGLAALAGLLLQL